MVQENQVPSIALSRDLHVKKKMLATAASVIMKLDTNSSQIPKLDSKNVKILTNVISMLPFVPKVTVSTWKVATLAHVSLDTISSFLDDHLSQFQQMLKGDSRHHKVAEPQLVSLMITGKCLLSTR